jgi:2-hydroxy-3-oxopropionate reductase
MTNIAFIGLGIVGSPMAVHLADAGHRVAGYNHTPEKAKPLVEAGGQAAESIADAVRDAEVVCVMVPDSPDVTEVLTGEGGVFANASAGSLVVDFSSIRPDVTVPTRLAVVVPPAQRDRQTVASRSTHGAGREDGPVIGGIGT